MSDWKTRPSICTCPSVICMPPSTRLTNLRFAQHRSSDRDDTATLRGGRCDPQGRQQVPRTRVLDLAAVQGARCHRPLPHRRVRRASRSVLQLRLSSHLLQLVPQPALPQVPDQRSRPVASQAAAGTAACGLLSPGLQRAARARAADVAEQAAALCSVVRSQRGHAAGSHSRSKASRRSSRFTRHPAHLGTDPAAPPAHPLRPARRRSVAGSDPLDIFALSLLPARQGAQPGLPRQVPCRTATRFSQPPTRLLRRVSAARQRKELHRLAALTVPAGLGRLCQAALWGTGTRSALSRALYPSRRHLQPSPALGLRLRGRLPLEGLRARQQAAHHDPLAGGVPAPLPPPCAAQRLPPYPLLRLVGQPHPQTVVAALPPPAPPTTTGNKCIFHEQACHLAVPSLPRPHARDRTTHRGAGLLRRNQTHRCLCHVLTACRTRPLAHASSHAP